MRSDNFTVLTLVALDNTGDSKYRLEWPSKSIALKRPNWRVINLDATAKERLTWALEADLLILIQSSDSDLLPIIRERKAMGLPTIVEYNDHFYEPPAWSPVAPHWSSPLVWEIYEKFIKLADVFMTTSKGLKNLFQHKASSNPVIIPNLFFNPIPSNESSISRKTKSPSIGWAGSLGHMADLLSLAPTLKVLSTSFEINAMGNTAIPSLLNIQNLKFTEWSSIDHYYSFWDPIWFGIVSIKDTPYNRCRSDIKPLELLSRGVIPVVQHTRTYESIIDKIGLPSFKELSEIPEILKTLTHDLEKQEKIRLKGYDYITKHRTESANNERLELYESLLKDKTPRSFPSSLQAGYHEMKGTTHPSSYTDSLVQITKTEKDLTEGFYKEYLKKCPDSADARIIYLSFLKSINSKRFNEELDQASTDFKIDLRFKLFQLDSFTGEEKSRAASLILDELRDERPQVVAFWKENLIKHLLPLKEIAVTKGLNELYPYDVSVLYQLAELLRVDGDYDAAHEFYERLKNLKLQFDPTIQSLDRAYLAALAEGTKCE